MGLFTPQSSQLKSRVRSAFFSTFSFVVLGSLALAGCSVGQHIAPQLSLNLSSAAQQEQMLAERANASPHGSLVVRYQRARALAVLAYIQEGPTQETLWQFANHVTLSLHDGRLYATGGFDEDIISISRHPSAADPAIDEITLHRRDASGQDMLFTGEAQWECSAPERVSLPLFEADLMRCEERISWQQHARQTNTFWLHPETGNIWAGEVTLGPDGANLSWQVARPWWVPEDDVVLRFGDL